MENDCDKTSARDGRRLRILEVARGLFIEEGFAACSMSTIAARVGGSKGTLYNYFPSKEALFSGVVHHECERILGFMFDGFYAHGLVLDAALYRFGQRYMRLVLGDEAMAFARMIVAESSRHPELSALFYAAGPVRSRVRLTSYLESEMGAKRLRPVDMRAVAEQFCDLCISGLYLQRLLNVVPPPDDLQIDAKVNAAVSWLLNACGLPVSACEPAHTDEEDK